MAQKKTDEQKAAEAQKAAELEALKADPIGDADREVVETEPLGYVDPKAQEQPEGYAPAPADVENPQPKAAKKAAAPAVTRADAQGGTPNA